MDAHDLGQPLQNFIPVFDRHGALTPNTLCQFERKIVRPLRRFEQFSFFPSFQAQLRCCSLLVVDFQDSHDDHEQELWAPTDNASMFFVRNGANGLEVWGANQRVGN